MQSGNDWRVLLVCGASGTGKTTATQALARRLGFSTLLVDDLRISLQALTTPETHPGLHLFSSDRSLGQMTPDESQMFASFAARGRLHDALLGPAAAAR